MKNVLLPLLRRFCDRIELSIIKRGYYPAGDGTLVLQITPALKRQSEPSWERFSQIIAAKTDLSLERLPLQFIKGVAHASSMLSSRRVAENMAGRARLVFPGAEIATEYSAASPGGGITLWAVFGSDDVGDLRIGASCLLKNAEETGFSAANELSAVLKSDAVVDEHLADQLVPYLAMSGKGHYKTTAITQHCKGAMLVVRQILGVELREEGNIIHKAA
jgi:RNA 3'-terminal phosphate cyclase